MISPSELKFENQLDAADKLFEILPKNELISGDYVLICSSLDSIVLTDRVARALGLSYELLFSEQITAPNNPECEVGMVSETEEIVINEELINAFNITLDFIYGEAHRKYEEKILKNVYRYRKGKLLWDLQGRNILLIDEGCETGATAVTCIKTLINLGVKSITYATPLMPSGIVSYLNTLIDNIFCVRKITNFVDVDFYYNNKIDLNSDSIMSILEESPYYLPLQK
ncbi:phosphoribosyltransferase family protein [Campylobacter hyointestinalis]|uniref:phosphoribosyltransferase family protein n=1 Tax=Campylobacter hyointestinalis TaxID=198 RepID=UPI0004D4E0A5|nr:phosphoribosyltransferase family protein [Campylobacter hyointestinalis]ANE32897.1 putative phosphoribosyltransferase [Campylobacter hyointestinalis subsp. hyointestinalis LMG 9260]KEA43703.1 sodium:proton antiporter [Campylobacter hyointestinalis subsp. hyointestinalis]MDL2347444.1 phosphoribosyltransferase family protein [Campylobacter hyointestinalis]MDL2349095.1 phosphoribosyltransferase family protein [Campylobacter hyointestinalis]MDL2350934.1 phosphoribosyltransferase family protein 